MSDTPTIPSLETEPGVDISEAQLPEWLVRYWNEFNRVMCWVVFWGLLAAFLVALTVELA